jgi:hypothetical protein
MIITEKYYPATEVGKIYFSSLGRCTTGQGLGRMMIRGLLD